MSLFRLALAVSLWLAAPKVAACDDSAYGTLVDSFQARLNAITRREALPGAVAAFGLKDCPIAVAAAGFADVERRVPIAPDAKFMSGSIGKSFVAALVLDLANDGYLSLDQKIEKWLGTAPWFDRLPNAHDVTLRMLLNHSSGIPDYLFTTRFLHAVLLKRYFGDPRAPFSPEQLIAIVLDRAPLFPAGGGYNYTDTEYVLLGLIVERATGRTYYDLLGERILGPLQLTLTVPADRLEIPGLVSGYHRWLSPLPSKVTDGKGALLFHPQTEWTGGGLATNPRDLVSWGLQLYEGRAFKWHYLELLNGSFNPLHGGLATAYGMGLFVYATPLGEAYGHSGWFPGYTGSMLYFPASRLAVAFQTNTDRAGNSLDYLLELAKVAMPSAVVEHGESTLESEMPSRH
ncbi:MAG TPA: serine hydrolase domain-containing protein [Myxococcota bacterium]|nr:serine hydrolase domain-containing protein [Myxococcota bacterium]